MADVTFEEVLRLAKQLNEEEQKTLIERLQDVQHQPREKSEGVKRVRRKAYAKARRYWESVGDVGKLALTDEELDEQFGAFEDGIPRLKSELSSSEPRPGTLAHFAKIAKEFQFDSGIPDLASRSDEYLQQWLEEDARKKHQDEE